MTLASGIEWLPPYIAAGGLHSASLPSHAHCQRLGAQPRSLHSAATIIRCSCTGIPRITGWRQGAATELFASCRPLMRTM